MTEYDANSKKVKEGLGVEKKEKEKITSVVSADVVVQKKGLGRKIKDLIVEADFRSVSRYVFSDVLIPALRDMIVDGASKGVERMMYGSSTVRRRNYGSETRISYNSPIRRSYSGDRGRNAPPVSSGPRVSRQAEAVYIVSSREEGDLVLERMNDIADKYDCVTVGDLHELLGLASSHVDQKWGWVFVGDATVRQVREGYLLDLPPADPIN